MRHFVSWLGDNGRINGPVDWTGYFDEALPAVGDTITEYFEEDDFYDAIEVVERCLSFGHNGEQFWHFLMKHVPASQGAVEITKKARESYAEAERERKAESARVGALIADIKRKIREKKGK